MDKAVAAVLATSVIINSVALWHIYGLVALLYWGVMLVSVGANFFAAWYVTRTIKRMSSHEELLDSFVDHLNTFEEHLGGINQLELYVGDPSIAGLIKHTRDFRTTLLDYARIFYLEEEIDVRDEEASTEET